MLYLENIQESQVLIVPKPGAVPTGELVFKAKSSIDLDVKVEEQVQDLDVSGLYFFLAVALPANLPNGEYEYSLEGGNQVLSTGVLIIGTYANSTSQYNKEITYEQYETE